jgi:hypothetical protein
VSDDRCIVAGGYAAAAVPPSFAASGATVPGARSAAVTLPAAIVGFG